jgi:hypothetical protein
MESFYTLKIYERHEIHEMVKGIDKVTKLRNGGWNKFNCSFDIYYSVITCFSEYVLFEDTEDTGLRCIKVFFQDGSHVHAAYSWDAFNKWMNDVYLPVYNNWSKNLTINNKEHEKTES